MEERRPGGRAEPLRRLHERPRKYLEEWLDLPAHVHHYCSVSCKKGCAACCRMLVPVSAPEAFALKEMVHALPEPRRLAILNKIAEARTRLAETGLLARLTQVAETEQQLSDEQIELIRELWKAKTVDELGRGVHRAQREVGASDFLPSFELGAPRVGAVAEVDGDFGAEVVDRTAVLFQGFLHLLPLRAEGRTGGAELEAVSETLRGPRL